MHQSHLKSTLVGLCIAACVFPSFAENTNLTKTGDVLGVLIPASAYGLTFYKGDDEGRQQFYKSFATTLAVTQGLKNTVNATRPNGGSKSFPSGHTSGAFQGAAFIHARYGFEAALPAYAASTLVGYSRIDGKFHYTHDVIAGAAIGVAASMYFTKQQFDEKKAVFIPFIEPKQVSLLYVQPL